MKRILITIFFIFVLVVPNFLNAQGQTSGDKVFQAIVTEVVQEKNNSLPDGTQTTQQQLRLHGLDGEFKGKDVFYNGIGDVDVIKNNLYRKNDKVLVLASIDDKGNYFYYVTDYVRTTSVLYLGLIFLVILFAVGGLKGIRSIVSLILSFSVIMWFIVPQILDGADPVTVTIIGALLILLFIIYLTEGWTKEAHVGVVSIFISLLFTVFLSWLFVNLAKLSGLATEETSFLIGLGVKAINFKGLLMAGIIIGSLGVLDDVVIAQVETVNQLYKIDAKLSVSEAFSRAYKVGVSHISSMTNTLFLAYAGASLAILILFSSGQSGYTTWSQAINNEMLATEIVRTLAGSIGLILAVPLSTFIAAYWLKK
ncbi:MAG: YibE/F family protein [bacterium]